MSAPKPSPCLAILIEEQSFALEGLAELLRLTGWMPESVVLETAAQSRPEFQATLGGIAVRLVPITTQQQ